MSEIIEVNAIVSTGGTVTSVTIGETTYTGSASADLGTALTDNSTVVVTDYNWSGGKLTKQGITVIGGTAALLTGHTTAENGAALQTSGGTSYLSGLTFSNNRSTRTSPSQGGAYYNTAVATVSNTLFIGNTANRGGAVYAIGTLTVFNDCLFSGNTGTTHGGAINRYEATGSPLTRLVVIHGGTFSENASPAGGAVINTGRMEIGVSLTNGRDVLFEKNRGSAAVMNISSGTMSLGHATFDGNTNGAINNRDAGSVLIINGLITLKTAKDTFVNGGTAAVEGEAFLSDALRINKVVANAGGVTLPNFEVVAGDLGFTVTTAKLAGDLYVLQDGLTITPIVSAFGDVYQTVAGGTTFYGNGYSDLAAALAANSAVVVTGYTVSGATSTLFISGKTLIGGTGAVFSDNLIGGTNGGPLAVTNVALSGMTFSGNQGRNGGTLAVSGNSNILSGLVFSGNRAMNATSYGGAVYSNDGSGVFSNSVFIGNTATRGGAVSLGGGTNTFNDCVFSGNTGTSHGGAINRYGTGTQTGILLVIHGGTFSENASASGGAIVNSGRAEIGASLTDGKDALFEKNRGSAAIVNLGGATAAIGHAAFDGNTKGAIENRANGIAYINGLITLKSSADTIVNNGTITVDGAAFLTGETVVAKVIDTDFSGAFLGGTGTLNATTGYQNLKYANDLYVTLDEYTVAALLSDSLSVDTVATLTSGDVTYVGGVYDDLAAALAENGLAVLSDSTLHSGVQTLLTGGTARGLQNAVFTGNASSNGGAVRITGTAELSGLTFSGNSASGAGGALYTNGASVVSDSTFSGNTASRGGAFHLNGSTATFRDVNWFGNQAGTGGALQNNVSDKPEQEVRIYGGTFSGNSASNGAAIFNKCVLRIAKSETTGENVRFDGNLGSHAIVNDGGTIYLADAIFRDNANALNNVGGAVYISGSTFATAADGIYNNNGALEFSGSNILNAGISGSGSVDLASDAALVFDNIAEIGIIGLTFGGSNAVTFNGSEKVNFIKSGGQDLSGVAITVDGSAYAGSEIVVATGVSAIGNYTVTGADDLTLYTAGGKMVLADVSNTMSGGTTANFVGGTSNLMTGGTVTAAFFGTRNNSGSVRTVFTGGTVVNSMVAGALVQAKDTATAALDTVSVDIYDGVSLLGGTANGGMNYVAGYAYGRTEWTELPGSANYTVGETVLNLSGSSISGNLYAGAHARKYAYTSVAAATVNVTGGIVEKLYGGGWAERGDKSITGGTVAKSDVGTATVNISGGSINRLYAGGGNSYYGYTSVDTANLTISGGTVDFVFLGGRNINCFVGDTTLTITGAAQTLTRISGHNDCGVDNTTGTAALNVQTNVTLGYLDYVDRINIAEACTLNITDWVLYDDISQELSVYLGTDGFDGTWDIFSATNARDIDTLAEAQFYLVGGSTSYTMGDTIEIAGGSYSLNKTQSGLSIALSKIG